MSRLHNSLRLIFRTGALQIPSAWVVLYHIKICQGAAIFGSLLLNEEKNTAGLLRV